MLRVNVVPMDALAIAFTLAVLSPRATASATTGSPQIRGAFPALERTIAFAPNATAGR